LSTYIKQIRIENEDGTEKKTVCITRLHSDDYYERNRNHQLGQAEAYTDSVCKLLEGESLEDFKLRWTKLFLRKVDELCREKGI
jgi:hypothetical protein